MRKFYYSVSVMANLLLSGCLGSSAEEQEVEVNPNPGELTDNETYWQEFKLVTPTRNGLMNPYFDAVIDEDKNIHLVYYSLSEDAQDETDSLYDINYTVWNSKTQQLTPHASAGIISTQIHSDEISLARDGQNQLYVTYRGGVKSPCSGGTVPADTMFSVFNGTAWTEYTGAVGYVDRSGGPLLDGHAGSHADIAVDNEGNLHLTYLFAYEGCDATNFSFPDLFYAGKSPEQFSNDTRTDSVIEEQVSGNDADNGGTFQNKTGEVSDIILDHQGNPWVFYYSYSSSRSDYGLYVANRGDDGTWKSETIREDCTVVDVDSAIAKNGDIHVAYVIESCDDEFSGSEFSLRHARKLAATVDSPTPQWENGYVVDNVQVGGIDRHLSMVINQNDLPQIAYFELQTYSDHELKNLTSVELNVQGSYTKKDIARWNDIGRHNKMLVDNDGEIYALSYSPESQSIHLFIEGINGRLQ